MVKNSFGRPTWRTGAVDLSPIKGRERVSLHQHAHRHVVEAQVLLGAEGCPEIEIEHELDELESGAISEERRQALCEERTLHARAPIVLCSGSVCILVQLQVIVRFIGALLVCTFCPRHALDGWTVRASRFAAAVRPLLKRLSHGRGPVQVWPSGALQAHLLQEVVGPLPLAFCGAHAVLVQKGGVQIVKASVARLRVA